MINARFCQVKGHENNNVLRICTYKACNLINKWVCADCSFEQIHLHEQSNQNHIMQQDQFLLFIKQQTENIIVPATENTVAIKKVDQLIQTLNIFLEKLKNDLVNLKEQYNFREIQNITNMTRYNYYQLDSQQIKKIVQIDNNHIRKNSDMIKEIFIQIIKQFHDLQQLLQINYQKELQSVFKEEKVLNKYFQHIQLSADDFEPRFNKVWSINHPECMIKGPQGDQMKYFYPRGWRGYALKVQGKYDDGNDDWLQSNSNPNQWHIMYHGTRQQCVQGILKQGLQPGQRQCYLNLRDLRQQQQVGTGVYFSNHIEVAELYADPIQIENITYKVVFQVRVRPESLKQIQKESQIYTKRGNPDWNDDFFLVNKPEDIRSYRILLKEEQQYKQGENGVCSVF